MRGQNINLTDYYMSKFSFIKTLFSPFNGLKLKFYFGEIKKGVPYFYPRKWVKDKDNPGYMKAVYFKYFGINTVGLGYKTKWSDDDYRFEWNPMISIVLFGKQLVVWFLPNVKGEDISFYDTYWETWLMYEYHTDKTKNKAERLKELFEKHSCTYTSYSKDGKKTTDYYPMIVKDKWLKISEYNREYYEKIRMQQNEIE